LEGTPWRLALSLEASKLQEFSEAFENSAAYLTEEDLRPIIIIDAEANPEDLSLAICKEVDQMEPFGMGNSRPVFSLMDCRVENVRILKEKHLKLQISKNGWVFNAIGFNMVDSPLGETVDLAFVVERNEWRGDVNLQLQLKAIGSL